MIKRSRREHVLELVESNKDWNVLDLGCGRDGIKLAGTYADGEEYSSFYPKDRFVRTEATETPFEDKEFDFVFSLHIIEHILDPHKFCKELIRISKRGFIEVPTPFFDNFVEGNSNPPPHGHVWWITFDDIENEMVFKPRLSVVREMLVPADTTNMYPLFRDSMLLELYWEDTIELRKEDSYYSFTAGNSDPPKIIDLRKKKNAE